MNVAHTHTHTHTHTKKKLLLPEMWCGQLAPESYRSASAQACCKPGLIALGIEYSGIISNAQFRHLDRQTLGQRLVHRLSFERMDKALTLPGPIQIDPLSWPKGAPVSIIMVRDDQYEASQLFCYELGLLGITRLTFRISQMALALALMDRLAG